MRKRILSLILAMILMLGLFPMLNIGLTADAALGDLPGLVSPQQKPIDMQKLNKFMTMLAYYPNDFSMDNYSNDDFLFWIFPDYIFHYEDLDKYVVYGGSRADIPATVVEKLVKDTFGVQGITHKDVVFHYSYDDYGYEDYIAYATYQNDYYYVELGTDCYYDFHVDLDQPIIGKNGNIYVAAHTYEIYYDVYVGMNYVGDIDHNEYTVVPFEQDKYGNNQYKVYYVDFYAELKPVGDSWQVIQLSSKPLLTGCDAIVITTGTFTVVVNAHTSVIVQNNKGKWFYFYWGNKNAVLLEVPTEKLSDLTSLNAWLVEKGAGKPGEKTEKVLHDSSAGYTTATYIEGNFSDTYKYYLECINATIITKEIDPKGGFKYDNIKYDPFARNCEEVSFDGLKKGILPNGTVFGDFVVWNYFGSIRPNDFRVMIREIFLNQQITKSSAREEVKKNASRKWVVSSKSYFEKGKEYAKMIGVD